MTLHLDREARLSPGKGLDPKIIGQYSSRLFEKIARLYLDVTPGMVQEAQSALGQRDATTIRQTCHALKSSSANVGAMELSDLCRELEAAAHDEDLAKVSVLMPRFVESHKAIIESLNNHLEEFPTE